MKIPVANTYIGEREASKVYQTVKSGWISMGKNVQKFEKDFAKFVDSKYAIAVNSGTAALHLALIASDIKKGDHVLIPDITFASTAKVVLYENANPILVECDPKTYNIDLVDAAKKITKKTKAIISVDMNGMPVDYDKVSKFAKKHKLKFISDSAESLGAIYKNKKVGSIAPIHAFSFFPNKNLTTGEGGMITLNNKKIYEYMKKLRTMGQIERYNHQYLGYNYRMTDISASIGIEQLKEVRNNIKYKQNLAEQYDSAFENNSSLKTPYIPKYVTQHAWYSYTISLDDKLNRDEIRNELKKSGIETRVSFPPLHKQPFLRDHLKPSNKLLPISEKAWKKLINIPLWRGLSKREITYIVKKIDSLVLSSL